MGIPGRAFDQTYKVEVAKMRKHVFDYVRDLRSTPGLAGQTTEAPAPGTDVVGRRPAAPTVLLTPAGYPMWPEWTGEVLKEPLEHVVKKYLSEHYSMCYMDNELLLNNLRAGNARFKP